MKKFICLIILIGIFNSSAEEIKLSQLKTGDLLLQPLNCWLCNLIEAETNSNYSHIGVVAKLTSDEELVVLEAWGSVVATTISKYLAKTQKNEKIEVLRPILSFDSQLLISDFKNHFENLKYDSHFLWNNFDEDNNEMIYCSELVAKLFNLQNFNIQTATMYYSANPQYWDRYFQGTHSMDTPRGEQGVSPVAFKYMKQFKSLGFLADENKL